MIREERDSPTRQEWGGFYNQSDDTIPIWIVKGGNLKDFKYGHTHLNAPFTGHLHRFYVGSQYITLIEVCSDGVNSPPSVAFHGWLFRVKVDTIIKKALNTQFPLLFGKLDEV